MWQIKRISKYQKYLDLIAVIAVVTFLVLALLVPSVKVFFVLAFAFFAFLTINYSFPKAFIYSTLPLTYVSLAQSHPILVVPAKAIVTNQYWQGRHIGFGFTPYLFISLVALLIAIIWQKKFKDKSKLANHEKLLIIVFGCGILSGIYGSLISWLSVLSVSMQFLAIVWAWYLSKTLRSSDQKQQQEIFLTIFMILATLITYESFIVFRQTISKSPIGLEIEKVGFAPSFGAGADENFDEFRPFGLQAHPNGLANKQLILGFSILLIYQQLKFKKNKKLAKYTRIVLSLVLTLMLINIILSLSRAVFLALFIGLTFIFLRHRKKSLKIIKELKQSADKMPFRYKFIFLLIGFGLLFKLATRMTSSVYSFTEFGGVSTRLEQYKEAIEVFKKSPIFGIGDEMFIPTSYQLFPKGVMSYFPENVHNGFLLFMIERGILGTIAYLTFITTLLFKIHQSNINKLNKSIVYSGLIAVFTVMMFHPEKNFITGFLLFTLAIFNFNYEKKLQNQT